MTESTVATLITEVQGRDVNLTALLARVRAELTLADAASQRTATALGVNLTGGQQRAATSALGLSQAYARLAVAEGDTVRAQAILNTGLAANASASERAIVSVQTQIARLESGSTLAKQFGTSLQSSLLGIVGPAAAAAAALGAVRSVMSEAEESFKFVAALQQSREAITVQLRGLRDTASVFRDANAFAARYKLTQAEVTEAMQAAIPVIRSSRSSLTEILTVFDQLRAKRPDKTFGDAARALDELRAGQIISIVDQFNIARPAANAMKREIEGGADAVQVLSKFLTDSGIGMDALEAKTRGAAGALRDLARAEEERKIAFGELAAQGTGFVELEADSAHLLAGVLRGDLNPTLTATAGTLRTTYGGALLAAAQSVATLSGQNSTAATVLRAMAAQQIAEGQASRFATAADLQQASASQLNAQAMASRASLTQAATSATQTDTAATEADIAAKVLASSESQILSTRQELLAAAALQAAQGLSVSGNAAVTLANQFGITVGEADQLIARMRILAQLQNTLAVGKATNIIGGGGGAGAFLVGQEEAAHKKILGIYDNIGRGAGRLNDNLRRIHGVGGAARLSDQQKLGNSLLADQEKFEDQSEAAEREHQQKLLDIEREFQRKSLEQQRTNEVSKRQSRADFYDDLTSATKDVGGKVATELSASYEQAYAQAQKIAQNGNQKLADDYLKLKQRQIHDELEFQKRLAEAGKNRDKGEIERLNAVHKLQQDANAEEEKQLLAGGDTNVKARDEALTEEQRRFEEQQGKMVTAHDAATQRKIDNAEREGKKIDELNLKYQAQADILNKIAQPVGPATPGAPATPPPTTPTTPAAATAPPDVVTALGNLQGALITALAALSATTKEGSLRVVNAVNGIGPRLVQ